MNFLEDNILSMIEYSPVAKKQVIIYHDIIKYELDMFNQTDSLNLIPFLCDLQKSINHSTNFHGILSGAAASSYVFYLLGLSNLNPLNNNLIFERFHNPGRNKTLSLVAELDDSVDVHFLNKLAGKHGLKILSIKDDKNDIYSDKGIKSDSILILDKNEAETHPVKSISMGNDTNIKESNYCDLELYKLGFQTIGIFRMDRVAHINRILQSIENTKTFDEIAPDEKAIFEGISNGAACEYFYFNTNEYLDFLFDYKPGNLEELSLIIALEISGRTELFEYFIQKRNDNNRYKPYNSFPFLLLDNTFGRIIYQEQIIEIFHDILNIDFAEANEYRILISKYRDNEKISELRERFVNNNYIDYKFSSDIFLQMQIDAKYSVCKAYSMKIAYDIYMLAKLKRYFPEEYNSVV